MSLRNSLFSDMSSVKHRDLVAAGALRAQHGLVGAAQQIATCVSRPGTPERDTDTDGAGEHLAVDRHPLAQRRLQPVAQRLGARRRPSDAAGTTTNSSPPRRAIRSAVAGLLAQPFGEHPDEPVAGVVAQVVVDRLEPVEVEEQRRDRARPGRPAAGRRGGPSARGGCAVRSGRRARRGSAAGPRRRRGPAAWANSEAIALSALSSSGDQSDRRT